MLMIKSHTDFTDIISATAQPRLIITSLPQPITAARPEGSNARAERVARSRGWSKAKPSVSLHPSSCEEREYHLLWRLFSRLSDAFLLMAYIPGVALTLNPRLKALGLRPRRSTFQVGYHRDCRGNKKTEIITNIARINTALCKCVF